jgi:carbon starvation protein
VCALILSVRHKARSIGDLAGDIIGKKATTAYMVIMFFVVVLLTAIFLRLISGLLTKYPEVVIPAAALVIVAVGIGVLIYRTKVGLGVASIVGICLMLLSVWIGTQKPLELPAQLGSFRSGSCSSRVTIWNLSSCMRG